MNIGEECEIQFGCKNGPCPSCGMKGGCCKKGRKGCGCNGIYGGENRSECTDITSMELLILSQNKYIKFFILDKFISNLEPNRYRNRKQR